LHRAHTGAPTEQQNHPVLRMLQRKTGYLVTWQATTNTTYETPPTTVITTGFTPL